MSASNPPKRPIHVSKSQLESTHHLIVDAIIAMTSIVESMHHRISPLSHPSAAGEKERTTGLTRLVYTSIYSITALVGKALDTPLKLIAKSLGKGEVSASGEALKAALNGIMGDHLVNQTSSLAIPMTYNVEGRPIDVADLIPLLHRTQGKLVIMVHGLCMNHLQWDRDNHDHGKALSDDLGVTTVYLHYNTGQHIFDNGIALSHLLEQLVSYSTTVDNLPTLDISIVAHSMGGLVSRSAFHHAKELEHTWPNYFDSIVFLGTPHHGAPLEKAGGWVDMLLGIHPYSAPLTRLTSVRSAGIRDLRHGNIVASDAKERHRFDFAKDKRSPLTLPSNVKCFAIGTTTSAKANKISDQLMGDGLVPLDSAMGRHNNASFSLVFPASRQWIGRDINHMQLLSHPDVYRVINQWLLRS